ncbi:MAG: tRNA-dihydrouridine synthase [Phycisphaerae bacterium]|nr:tRNA-dihydrouridine synthase [Phycisphaerae bacterium]
MPYELKPFSIGPIQVASPVVLAALAGYSDLAYRKICRQLGCPYSATEAMLDTLMLADGKLRRRLVKLADDDHPVAGQIMGCTAESMSAAAVVLAEMGFDAIDLNFACPVRKVLGRHRGGWMMGQPDLVIDIIGRVLDALAGKRPLTIKLRRAFHEADREYEAFYKIARFAYSAGVASVCVHARSVSQKYTGKADWSFLAAARREFPGRTLLGSGDAFTPADAIAMIQQTGVDGVTAARGAIGNPWFFRQVQDVAAGREPYHPAPAELRRVMEDHFRHACELYGPRRAPKIMRKFGIKYARMHPHPAKVRLAFINVKKQADWQAVLEEFFPDK